jgi:hypothetical protein
MLFSLWGGTVSFSQEACSPCGEVEESTCDPCDAAACDPCGAISCDETFHLFKKKHGRKSFLDSLEVFGWIQGGVYANSRGNTIKRAEVANYNNRTVSQFVPATGNSSNLLSTVQSTDFQINQVWLGVKKDADGTHGLDWGFAAEGFFGTDAWLSQSWGDAKFDYGWQDGDYHTAIPQLYAQLAYGDLSVKIGKFETIIGYETLRAPDFNFFSHSYTFMIEPYSHSGVYFEYTPNDRLSLGAGYITGTDASFENAYDDHGFLGTIAYQFTDKLNLSYAIMYNRNGYGGYRDPDDFNRYGLSGTNAYIHTVVASYDLSKKWNYSVQWDYSDSKVRNDGDHTYMYGISNYLTYQLNDHWGVGFRAEWANVNALFGYGRDLSEYTLCVNWKPYENISIRPEIRYDYGADKTSFKAFNGGENRDQFSGGITGVVSF